MKQNSDGTGAVAAGDPIGYWQDKSASAAHVTGSSTARPTFTNAAFNGYAAPVFNGSTTNLSKAGYTATNSLSGMTRIAVCGHLTNTVGALSRVYDGGSDFAFFQNASWRSLLTSGGATTSSTAFNGTGSILPVGLYAERYANSAVEHYGFGAAATVTVSGGTVAATTNGGTPALHIGSNIGANFFWNGPIAEYIIFNRALTRSELASVEAYLAAKWGIANVHAPAVSASDPVGYWRDRSGNGRHATQATGASRPTISATAVQNRRALGFNGTSGRLALPSMDSTPSTVLAVARHNSGTSSAGRTPLCIMQGGSYMSWQFQQTGTIRAGVTYNAAQNHFTANGIDPQGSVLLLTGQMSSGGGGLLGRLNGATLPFTETVAFADGGQSRIGCRFRNADDQFWSGEVCEVLHYQSALSLSQVQRLERYLAARWGITLAPQVGNAEAQDWINRVYANGGTVSTSTANAVNTFCNDIDAAGIRNRFYRLNLFCGGTSGTTVGLNSALVPLYRGPSLTGQQYGGTIDDNVGGLFVGGDYNETGASGGLLGNGSSKYLNTALNVSDLPGAANCHLSSYITGTQDIQAVRALVGVLFNGVLDRYRLFLNTSSGSNYSLIGDLGKANSVTVSRANTNGGLLLISRTSTILSTLYDDGVSVGTPNTTETTETTGAFPFFVFARGQSGNPSEYYNGRMAGYSIGAGMTDAQVTSFYNAMNTFQTALSRNQA